MKENLSYVHAMVSRKLRMAHIRDVGFKPDTSIDEGIGQFVKWYRGYYE